jgi:hypothetical protein
MKLVSLLTISLFAVLAAAACSKNEPKPGTGGSFVLAKETGCPAFVALDADNVYFATTGGLLDRVPKAGGKVQNLTTGLHAPSTIAIDGPNVIVAQQGSIVTVPKAGGGSVPIASGLGLVPTFVFDQTDIYFVDYGKDSTIARVAKGGGVIDRLVTVPGWVQRLAIDESSIYFVSSHELVRLPKHSGMRQAVGATIEGDALAVDANAIFAIDGHSFVRIDKKNGKSVKLADFKGSPQPFVDDRDLIWNEDGSKIMAVIAEGGGRAREVAGDQPTPRASAADATTIYWANCGADGDGSIAKKAR